MVGAFDLLEDAADDGEWAIITNGGVVCGFNSSGAAGLGMGGRVLTEEFAVEVFGDSLATVWAAPGFVTGFFVAAFSSLATKTCWACNWPKKTHPPSNMQKTFFGMKRGRFRPVWSY